MAIRVDKVGFGKVLDPVSGSSTSGGAPVYDDGIRTDPSVPRPWSSMAEAGVSETLRLMSIPGEQLASIRPPVPYVLFPDQELGFVLQPPTIEDVLDTDRWSPRQRSWMSPTVRPNLRSSYVDDAWSGSARNASVSGA